MDSRKSTYTKKPNQKSSLTAKQCTSSLFNLANGTASRDLLLATLRGEEEQVISILRSNLSLALKRGNLEGDKVNDYSGRVYHGLSTFQLALCAGDEVLAKKIYALYVEANPEQGYLAFDAQFNEVFPNGYAAHLEEQKRSADEFERNILNPLIDAIDSASGADLEAALNKRGNGSELCRKLRKFKDAFHELSMQEKIYNPNHLLKVFEKYDAKFNEWSNKFNNHDCPPQRLFWCQVIGWEERYMPANYAQSFCTGLRNMVDNHQPLQRTLTLRNYDTKRDIQFFPLHDDSASKLGLDFGVYSYNCAGGGCMWLSLGQVRAAFAKLISSKNIALSRIMQPESRRRNSPWCLIQ